MSLEMPPEGARQMMRAMGQLADVPRGEIAKVEDRTIPGPAGDIPIRIYRSGSPNEAAMVLYIHGGGFILGGLDSHDDV